MTDDEMVEWHHQLNGDEFEQSLGDCEGHGGLMCCSPWGHKESETTVTEQKNNNRGVNVMFVTLRNNTHSPS